jgi:hypothetical protein
MRAPVYSDTIICNLALADVPDKPIASLQEVSLQARECLRQYAQCCGEMLEMRPWTFALARVTLAQVTNDRKLEWCFAYQTPNDCAFIGKVFQNYDAEAASTQSIIPGTVPARQIGSIENWRDHSPQRTFELGDNGVLYTDCPFAAMEYTRNAVSESVMRPQFVRALAALIASRIAMPLTKDMSRRNALTQIAEQLGQLAASNDRNRERETWGDYTSSWTLARAGVYT